MSKSNISAIVHTRNEIENIKECIKSIKGFANEIILIDMESNDGTVELAQRMGAKVYSIKNYGIVEPARQYGINKASGDWILIIDADERLTKNLSRLLRFLTKQNKFDVVRIPFKNIIFGKWFKKSNLWPDYHARFFRKGCIEWPSYLDSEPEYNHNKTLDLPAFAVNAIVHESHPGIDGLISKINRYSNHAQTPTLTSQALVERMLLYPQLDFSRRYLETGGKDGMEGYIFARVMEFYEFIKWAKYWEKNKSSFRYSPLRLHSLVAEHNKR